MVSAISWRKTNTEIKLLYLVEYNPSLMNMIKKENWKLWALSMVTTGRNYGCNEIKKKRLPESDVDRVKQTTFASKF